MDAGPEQRRPIREVGGYRLLEVLGSGGMGTVYEAIDAEDRHVAVKLLHPIFSADDAARERLRREVATLHRVRGERVSRVLDAEADSAEAFIVTELIDGQSLEESVREHGPLDAEELADLADGLADALEAIHAVGVVHRDLKPGNVMLTDDGPVVIDFGISQLADDPRLTQTGLVTGTPGYVDPQVMRGADPGPVGDWWGWAAVLVFAATGRGPFGSAQGVLLRVEAGRVDTDGLPPRTAQVLRRALHPDPDRRMRPDVVRRALRDHATGREPTSLLADGDDDAENLHEPRTEVVADDPDLAAPLPPAIPPGSAPPEHTAVMPQQVRDQYPSTAQYSSSAQGEQPPPPDGAARLPDPVHPDAGPPSPSIQEVPAPAVQPPPYSLGPDGFPERPAWAVPARARPWLSLVWLAALSLLGGLYPSVVVLGAVVLVVIFGAIGSDVRALRQRRLSRGPGRWDLPRATAAFPLHVVLGLLLTLPGVVVAAAGVVIVWVLAVQAVPLVFLVPAVVAVAVLLLWWTPSSGNAREGQRTVLRVLAPAGAAAAVWALIAAGVGLTALALTVLGDGAVQWWPFPVPPTRFF
ncbi:serine/threonine-protein kinase [Ruania rhizosphaerae]|uniref:serine/threonine-protein kinase n=1 Tax=Ruania rhizosphaerae TaxID=1840413 RepID=UPI00135B0413|nr:serine/threonine-protein kinase [Ruania rhizosphaerae]